MIPDVGHSRGALRSYQRKICQTKMIQPSCRCTRSACRQRSYRFLSTGLKLAENARPGEAEHNRTNLFCLRILRSVIFCRPGRFVKVLAITLDQDRRLSVDDDREVIPKPFNDELRG